MVHEAPRSRAAREAAERTLVRIVHHYGSRPEFVVLGGLLPELPCAGSGFRHAGTTDVDVQVDLEIACGATNTAKLERAPMPSKCTLIIPTWIQERSLRTEFLRSRNSIDCCSRSDQCCLA